MKLFWMMDSDSANTLVFQHPQAYFYVFNVPFISFAYYLFTN